MFSGDEVRVRIVRCASFMTHIPLSLALVLVLGCTSGGREPPLGAADSGSGSDPDGGAWRPDGGPDLACRPGLARCAPDAPGTPEVCSADGQSWEPSAPCAAGEICAAGVCGEIHETAACREAAEAPSYLGCEFWGVTMANPYLHGVRETEFAVTIANPHEHPVRARIEGGALTAPVEQTIAPGDLALIALPWVASLSDSNASALERGGAYRVRTDAPVSTTQFNPITSIASADASTLLPTPALGDQYMVLTSYSQGTHREHPGSFAVVAAFEGTTTVTVRPRVATRPGAGVSAIAADATTTFELEQGDVLQLLAASNESDLSGTRVEADQPVALISGHLCANFPGTACDHLEEQTYPYAAWGRSYPVNTFGESGEVELIVRVLAARNDTTVRFEPESVHAPVSLDAGEVFQLTTSGQFVVTGTEPVLVAQFVSGRGAGGEDPSLVYAVPVEQFRPSAIFLSAPEFEQSFVNVVGPTGAPPVIDGVAVSTAGARVGAELSVWRVPLEGGVHVLGTGDASDAAYGLAVYGFRTAGSYAYPAGMDQQPINAPF